MSAEYIKEQLKIQRKTILVMVIVIVFMILRSIANAFFPDFFQLKFIYLSPMVFMIVWGSFLLSCCSIIHRCEVNIIKHLDEKSDSPASKDEL